MSIKEFCVLLMVCLIWGLHFIVMKVTVGQSAEPLFYAAVRMTLVAIILIPKLRWYPGFMLKVFGAGLGYGALNYAFMFPALEMTTASAAAIAIELYVPFSIILSMIVFKDKIGKYRFFGICLAFAGVALIASAKPDEAVGPYFLLGIILMIGAAMSEAVGAVLVKKVTGINPLNLLAWFAVIGSVVLWPLSFALESNQMQAFSAQNRMPFFLALLYSAVGVSLIAHASYYWLLQRLPIYLVATSGLMTTVIAVVASVLILGEPITIYFIIGGVMTLGGVGLIMLRNRTQTGTTVDTVTAPQNG